MVRWDFERLGTIFSRVTIDNFNNFIMDNDLVEVAMGGSDFTRVGDKGSKLSKLDKFLVSQEVTVIFHDLDSIALDLTISDHKPIFLSLNSEYYGRRLFKFFNSWMFGDEFDRLVCDSWSECVFKIGESPSTKFKNKLQNLKIYIKKWSGQKKTV